MAVTGNNFIDFVSELIYGDMGSAELGMPPAPGGKNHIHWTRDNIPSSAATVVTGDAFLAHHLDYMLARYEAWHSKYLQPPVRPWDGQSPMAGGQSPTVPGLGPLPATTDALGTSVRQYYNATFRGTLTDELADEVKAPYSYRYWAFMRWASDLRRRVLGQPVVHVHTVFDRDGTVLSEKDFTDIFHQVHHVWHPNGPVGSGWVLATPFHKTSVGQHIGKQEISRTQVGAEFFTFHRDHIDVFDRWLARTGQDPIQAINACAHDTAANDPPPPGVEADFSGYPHIDSWAANPPAVVFNDVHTTYWESDLHEFANLGEMGQRFATDHNQFPSISVPGTADAGYHGTGHVLNGDLLPPVDNNHSPRFFAWHGFNDAVWRLKREPRLDALRLVQADDSDFPEPGALTILRDLPSSTDAVEPAAGVAGIDLATGEGTVRVLLNVQPDHFNRTLGLALRCEVLREADGIAPVVALSRELSIVAGGAPGAGERLQGADFIEEFAFDGSPGTVDGDGDGPFAADNALFTPTAVGFKNSRIRISAHLTCTARPDGSVQAVAGTLSSAGETVTGSGSSFTTQLRQGDLIRANGMVRQITGIAGNTSLTLLSPFSPDLPAGTAYERLDGFDHESTIEIPMIQEKLAPEITTYLDRSTFSIEQVAASGTTDFDNAFYVVLQDRTARPFQIDWPPEVEPALYGLLAPPVYAAGLYTDLAHAPVVELRDEGTDALVPDVTVTVTAMQPEDPGLHPAIAQRVTCLCRVTFSGHGAFAGLVAPGDVRDVKLVVTATDRSGNQVTDDSLRVRLQVNPNPFMLDGPTPWLSVDARAFQVAEGQARFGVAAGWTDPNAFIQQAIANLRAGGGTAGGETFDSLPTDQGAARLEYSTSVGGVDIHNFALAQVHVQSAAAVAGVRATFRLLRWGTASVEFNDALTYRSDPPTGIGLLGQTTSAELASIPFFAEPRVAASAAMSSQADPTNVFDFGATGGAEVTSYYGAYLDINVGTLRYPQTYVGDGPFAGALYSIRDLLEDHHQCMVVELLHAGDPTIPGSTPGTSDNLAQRNLLIVQTANPGSPITRTVQHAFNIDLTRSIRRPRRDPVTIIDAIHTHVHAGDVDRTPPHDNGDAVGGHGAGHGAGGHHEDDGRPAISLRNSSDAIRVTPARPARRRHGGHHDLERELAHLEQGWLAQSPKLLDKFKARLVDRVQTAERWTFDPERWTSTTGLDELVLFWNELPADSEVELYLPGANVEEVFNFRSLRHAPGTVRIVDSHTLRLFPTGTTFLPIAAFWGDNLAGLLRVKLPAGIRKGQRFHVDVVQMRADEARTLGGFQLNIQVEKAGEIWEAERRTLELFHRRLSIKQPADRWLPIAADQVEFTRARARGLVELANEENPGADPIEWVDPTEHQHGRHVRVTLERIRITDDREPFFKGKGEFRFAATAWTPDNGDIRVRRVLPEQGAFRLSDRSGANEVAPDAVLFDDWVEDKLAIEIAGVELDTLDHDDRLAPFKRVLTGDPAGWFGSYGPTGEVVDVHDLGGWQLWLRIEPGG